MLINIGSRKVLISNKCQNWFVKEVKCVPVPQYLWVLSVIWWALGSHKGSSNREHSWYLFYSHVTKSSSHFPVLTLFDCSGMFDTVALLSQCVLVYPFIHMCINYSNNCLLTVLHVLVTEDKAGSTNRCDPFFHGAQVHWWKQTSHQQKDA